MAESKTDNTEVESTQNDWVKKMDKLSIGELRQKFPTLFYVVGGAIILALVF